MQRELLSELITVILTKHEKQVLIDLALSRGATMRGTVRKLIRDAGDINSRSTSHDTSGRSTSPKGGEGHE